MNKATTKIYQSDGRFYLYLPSSLVRDSAFPFKPGEDLVVEIIDDTLTVVKEAVP
ncbi:MAG: hypothetical protein ACETVR_03450 [Candidatus Bathyarchaeia archaeon]